MKVTIFIFQRSPSRQARHPQPIKTTHIHLFTSKFCDACPCAHQQDTPLHRPPPRPRPAPVTPCRHDPNPFPLCCVMHLERGRSQPTSAVHMYSSVLYNSVFHASKQTDPPPPSVCKTFLLHAFCVGQLLVDVFVLPLERWAKDLEAARDSGAARDQSSVASDLTQHGKHLCHSFV